MTQYLAIIFYQIAALAYTAFAAFLAVRSSHTRVAWLFVVAQLGPAIWAQAYVLAGYDLMPVAAFDITETIRDGGWLALCLALMHSPAGNRGYWWIASITA